VIWLGLACFIASLPAWVVLGFRVLRRLEIIARGRGKPWTTSEIAEEGRVRISDTDVSYIHHNKQVRNGLS